jgi:hypothetical protein
MAKERSTAPSKPKPSNFDLTCIKFLDKVRSKETFYLQNAVLPFNPPRVAFVPNNGPGFNPAQQLPPNLRPLARPPVRPPVRPPFRPPVRPPVRPRFYLPHYDGPRFPAPNDRRWFDQMLLNPFNDPAAAANPFVQNVINEPAAEPFDGNLVIEPEIENLVIEPEIENLVIEPDDQNPVIEPDDQNPVMEPEDENPVIEPVAAEVQNFVSSNELTKLGDNLISKLVKQMKVLLSTVWRKEY